MEDIMKTFKLFLAGLVIGLLVLGCDKKQEIEKAGEPQTATEQENPAQEDSQGETPEQPSTNNNEEPETPAPQEPGNNDEPQEDDPEAGLPSYDFLSSEAPAALTSAQKEKVSALNSFAFSFAGLMDGKKGNDSYVFSA